MATGVNTAQLRAYVIRPALQHIQLYSRSAENLVLGTALVESGGHFLKQMGSGPALGLFQMEPATSRDIWENYLEYNPGLRARISLLMTGLVDDDDYEMIGNLYYAAAMCRVHYRRVPDALPAATDYAAMAAYWKQFYNTALGAGTADKALPYFRVACLQ